MIGLTQKLPACLVALAVGALGPAESRVPNGMAAGAPDTPALPGLGKHDPRVSIDPNRAPWRAVVKVQATAGGLHVGCSGVLVAPMIVMTAAHCLFNEQTQRYFLPRSIHVLTAYDHGTFAGHAVARHVTIGTGYDPHHPRQTMGSDWATLTLDSPLGAADRILPLRTTPPRPGSPVMLGGYSQDRAAVITADLDCHIIGETVDGSGRRLLRHDCAATKGSSGGPVLVHDGGWSVIGVNVAAREGEQGGIAAIPETLPAVP